MLILANWWPDDRRCLQRSHSTSWHEIGIWRSNWEQGILFSWFFYSV